jgi:competence protein ComGC
MKISNRHAGFTATELLVILAVLLVAAALVLPYLAKTRSKSSRIRCVSKLKNVGLGFRIFATDHGDRFPMAVSTNEGGSMEYIADGSPLQHFLLLSNMVSIPRVLICPSDNRKAATDFASLQQKNVSYFVGLGAKEDQPQMLLAGDRNLATNGRAVLPGLVELTTNIMVSWTSEMHVHQGNVAVADGSVQQFYRDSVSPASSALEHPLLEFRKPHL